MIDSLRAKEHRVTELSVHIRTCCTRMDAADIKEWLQHWPIRYDDNHFPQRARERDKSAEWIIEQLKNGNITAVEENPRPSDFVQYDRAVILKVPKSRQYHYRIPAYIKESQEVYLKSVWQQRGE